MRSNSMCRSVFYLLLIFLTSCATKTQPEDIVIIPRPEHIECGSGVFRINSETTIYTNLNEKERTQLYSFLDMLPIASEISNEPLETNVINLLLVNGNDQERSLESYELIIDPTAITISAIDEVGLFYGIQSLLQLALDEQGGIKKEIPAVRIEDEPRFAYRGLHLDVSRHFMPKEFVKKQLDMMAYYKLNRFHWHLTDGAGWRIEIKRYPELTEIAAWRPYANWKEFWHNGRQYCKEDDPRAEGGYYTQEDIKEIVDYAQERHITIIPEIEMPGHSEEVLAVYPHLSCSGKPYVDSDFCIGNEDTFVFLENVLQEVMDLFPSEYLHIGGDEASKNSWKKCPKCQAKMKREGLENVNRLQSYMIHRIDDFLREHGRILVGWDEILEGGLAPGATVMSWRGTEGGMAAIKAGQETIMSPGSHCYFDAYQDAPHTQPEAIGGFLPLEKVYGYDPMPDTLTVSERALLLGVQANVWTEYIQTPEHVEYMIYPRLLALAEVGWTRPEHKEWNNFHKRALHAVDFLQAMGYNPFDLSKELGHRPETKEKLEHLACGKPVTYNTLYSPYYPAQREQTLTDGKRGDWTYSDGCWQGFIGRGFDVVVDMGTLTEIHSVSAEFMQNRGPEVWLPSEVIISVSEDGESFTELTRQSHNIPTTREGLVLHSFGWEGTAQTRYIRYEAKHSTAYGWLFTDEIVIQ